MINNWFWLIVIILVSAVLLIVFKWSSKTPSSKYPPNREVKRTRPDDEITDEVPGENVHKQSPGRKVKNFGTGTHRWDK